MSDDFVPDSKFVPDAAPKAQSGPDFVSDNDFQSDEEKYGSPLEMAKTFGEGALEAATLGLGTGAEVKLFDNSNEIRARREANPITHAVGQFAGIAAPALVGDEVGVAGLLSKAGKGGAELAGLGAEGAGVLSRIGAGAVKSGIEGAIFQGGDEVSKMLSSDPAYADPGRAAQTAAVNIGLAGLMGGVIGGGVSGGSELWDATFGKKVSTALNAANHAIEENPITIAPDAAAQTIPFPEQTGIHAETEEAIGDALTTAPTDLYERQAAASRLGVDLSPSMKANDPFAERLESSLSQRGTAAGRETQNELKEIHDTLTKKAVDTLKYRTERTPDEVAGKLNEDLSARFLQKSKELQKGFEEIEPELKKIKITAEQKIDLANKVLSDPRLKTSKAARSAANDFVEELQNVDNLSDLKAYRTNINNRIQPLFAGGQRGGEQGPILLGAKSGLTDLRESAIQNAVKEATAGAPEAKSISDEFIGKLRKLDDDWSMHKQEIRSVADAAGLPRSAGESIDSLTEKIGKLKDKTVIDRFFPTGSMDKLESIRAAAPKEFELARRAKLREIFNNSIDRSEGGKNKFSLSKFMSQIHDGKMNPNVRNVLFDGQEQFLKDLQTVRGALPTVFNPSHTAGATSFGEMFTPKGLLNEASDAVKYALLRAKPHLEEAIEGAGGGKGPELAALKFAASNRLDPDPSAFRQMANYFTQLIKGETALNKATKNIFEAGKDVVPSHLIPDDRNREKLDRQLAELQANNSPLFDVGGKLGHYMPDHASAVAQTAASGVNYLNSLRPNVAKMSPLDNAQIPSKQQKAAFKRALDIAQQPLLVLKSAKDGTITAQDITHLKSIYPDLYRASATKVQTSMIDAVHRGHKVPYRTRIGLSMFLGQPLDSTMTPSAIMAAQPRMPQAPQQGGQPSSHPRHSMNSLDKIAQSYQTPDQARQASRLRNR